MTAREMLEGAHPTPDQYAKLIEIDMYACIAKRWVMKPATKYAPVEAGIQVEHAAHWAFVAFPELREA